jgi:nickel-dependent lactate racemase
MKIDIQYGQGSMRLLFEEGRHVEVVSPKNLPADDQAVAKSITQPENFEDLKSFLAGRRKILVVINDHTRAPLASALKELPLSGKEVVTIIATGTHRPPSSEEMVKLLGGESTPYGGKVAIHACRNTSVLKPLGQTSRGTELFLNSQLFEADGIIAIGSVEPHYFAGFTGGRKFLLPALAGFRSVEMNHALALDERAKVLALEGNPVHEDFMEALEIFGRNNDIFSIQMVLNCEHQPAFASSGHIINSFMSAVNRARQTYAPSVEAKADIVVAVAKPPVDLDLYQAHKAIENAKLALTDGGVLILVSKCPDGIGNEAFYNLLTSPDKIGKLTKGYEFGLHKALKITQLLSRAKIFAVTDLPSNSLEKISISPFRNVQSAFDEATNLKGNESRVLIVDDAGVTVPVPEPT